MAMNLENQIILITGGGNEPADQEVKTYVDAGATVIIVGLEPLKLKALRDSYGDNVIPFQADLTQTIDLEYLDTFVGRRVGKLTQIIFNDTLVDQNEFNLLTPKEFDDTFAVNAKNGFFVAKVLMHYLPTHDGMIVYNTLRSDQRVDHPFYNASQEALRSLITVFNDRTHPKILIVHPILSDEDPKNDQPSLVDQLSALIRHKNTPNLVIDDELNEKD